MPVCACTSFGTEQPNREEWGGQNYYEPLCRALERTYMVSLSATILAAPIYFLFLTTYYNLWTE